MLIGQDAWNAERLLDDMGSIAWNPTAKSAVDMALADVRSQAAGVPFWQFFGGWTNEIPVSWRPPDTVVEEQVEQCLNVQERYGIRTFKIKLGMRPSEDVGRIEQLRAGLGDDVEFTLDANQGWDARTAVDTLGALQDLRILLVEEPCPIENDRARRLVARMTSIPIMGDESCVTPAMVRRQIELDVLQVVSIKVARTGFLLSQRIAHLCEQSGLANLCGQQADTSIGSICSGHFAASCPNVNLPIEATTFLDTAAELLSDPPVVKGGLLQLPDGNGLGIRIDERALDRFKV
jgi:L-alanine-DL-glutamate epimerase-like enolase superfamily enzyme